MRRGGGKGGGRRNNGGKGKVAVSMPTFSEKGGGCSKRGRRQGKRRSKGSEDEESLHTNEDTLGTTDLSREGIGHLKMQNTPTIKPRKHTPLLCRRLSVD